MIVQWQLRIVVEKASSVTWCSPPKVYQPSSDRNPVFIFFFAAGQARNGAARRCGDFVVTIRAELRASVEKSGDSGSRTYVAVKRQGNSLARRLIMQAGEVSSKNTALHMPRARYGSRGV
jgi:hypothetical protein